MITGNEVYKANYFGNSTLSEIHGKFENQVIRDLITDKIAKTFMGRKIRNLLDIGAGNGKNTRLLINITGNPQVDMLDVSPFQEQIFRKDSTNASYMVGDWETHEVLKNYDAIISRNSWYGIGKWKGVKKGNTLRKVFDSLSEEGTACIVIESEKNFFQLLRNRFFPIIHSSTGLANCEDLCREIEVLGIPFTSKTFHEPFSPKKWVSDGGLTQRGLDVMAVVLLKEFREIPGPVRKEITNMIVSHIESDMNLDMGIIQIRK